MKRKAVGLSAAARYFIQAKGQVLQKARAKNKAWHW